MIRGCVYFMEAIAGICFTAYPFRTVLEAIALVYTYGAGLSLLFGGTLALAGLCFRRWAGELLGIPLIGIALATFAIVLLSRGNTLGVTGLGILFVAFTAVHIERWIEVRVIQDTARGALQPKAGKEPI